jgi:hypothetical protein
VDGFAGGFERLGDGVRLRFGNDDRHSDSAVERPRQFPRSDPPAPLEQGENLRKRPPPGVYDGMTVGG